MEPEYIERSENERPYARTDADIDLDIDQLNTSIQEGVETLQERRRVWERRKGKMETIACGLRYVGTWVVKR